MTNQNLLAEVDSEVDAFGAGVILELAANWNEAWVVASDDLVLDEPFLEGMGLFEAAVVFF